MQSLPPLALAIAMAGPGIALAGDDCQRPMAQWQSRDSVTAHVHALGISTERLRIDDGCYEIRGRDGDGNLVGLKIDPASLAVLKLEVRFRAGADPSRYLPAAPVAAGAAARPQRPLGDRPHRPVPAAREDSR